ncbi:non-ribosomal peptide synthetase [Paenibacillus tepidiphilus]|uniref:non-ribosomal peptide synthetase n=1 Tax=Paenibacillus tepidiphilus TaxID=2608683 RepID=UPI00123B167A|nr:non-ribosomal peptide synthetase [Paenibacillus tepidiphilus]
MSEVINENILLLMPQYISAKKYWTDTLSGEMQIPSLPGSAVPSRQKDRDREEFGFELCQLSSDTMHKYHLDHPLIMYTFLLSILNVFIYKCTGQKDIIIGAPVLAGSGEVTAAGEGVLFRNQVKPDDTFGSLLNQVKQTVAEGFKNQHYPLSTVMDELNLSMQEPSVFHTMLVYEKIHQNGDTVKLWSSSNRITFRFSNSPDGLAGKIIFDANFYTPGEIVRIAESFKYLAGQALSDIGIIISGMDIVSEAEKETLLSQSVADNIRLPEPATIHQWFEAQTDRTPDKVAVVYEHESLTYRELDEQANILAHFLREHYDLKPDSLVGVLLDKNMDLIKSFLGILKAGGAYVPIHPDYPKDHIASMINDSGINIVISSKRYIKLLNELQWECPLFSDYVCLDTDDVYMEAEETENELMSKSAWEHIGENAEDDIAGGAWINSYTGEKFSVDEMKEYSDNVYHKLATYLKPESRVLEIGCASGLSMFRIAPHVGFYYGTDMSETIIHKNAEKIRNRGMDNIRLATVAAHDIGILDEKDFDIVILNSVCQCFNGHNYLRKVIQQAISLMKENGVIFIGDVMDLEKRDDLIHSLKQFKQADLQMKYRTKTDWSRELFLHKGYFEDLSVNVNGIQQAIFSEKKYTLENELTKFRYDVLLTVDKNAGTAGFSPVLHKRCSCLNDFRSNQTDRIASISTSEHIAYVIFTSGTTGFPKGTMVEHGNVTSLMQNGQTLFGFNEDDVWTMFHSPCFDFSVWEMYGALLFGGKLIVVPDHKAKETKKFLKLLKDENVTVLNQTPSAFYQLMELDSRVEDKELRLRYVIFGGEALKPAMLKTWKLKYPGTALINMYGITETTVHVTYKKLTDEDMDAEISNIGKPIPTLSAYIMDHDMKLVPDGLKGELCIGGLGVARGYLANPELTALKFVNNPYRAEERLYRSGDYARRLPNGDLQYLGRMDQQVKIRGYRIETGHIENALLDHEDIHEAVVTVDGEEGNEKWISAYYVGSKKLLTTEIKQFMLSKVPEYMIPSYFVELEAIPLNSNGKLDRKALPKPWGNPDDSQKYIAPRNEIERKMEEIWKAILGMDRVSVNQDFFEIGGHSLRAIKLEIELEKNNMSVEYADIYKYRTIEGLSNFLQFGEAKGEEINGY